MSEVASSNEPSSEPEKKKRKKNRRCCCSWRDCAEIAEKLSTEAAAADHPWSSNFFRLRLKTKSGASSSRAAVIRAAMEHHLGAKFTDENKDDFWIAPHHYTVACLKAPKPISTFITLDEAKALDSESGYTKERHADPCNQLFNLCRKAKQTAEKGWEGMSTKKAKRIPNKKTLLRVPFNLLRMRLDFPFPPFHQLPKQRPSPSSNCNNHLKKKSRLPWSLPLRKENRQESTWLPNSNSNDPASLPFHPRLACLVLPMRHHHPHPP